MITTGYKASDIDELHAMHERCYAASQLPSRRNLEAMLSISDVWISRAPELAGKITGCVIVRYTSPSVYIWSLAVDPDFQHTGIASALLDTIMRYYRERGEEIIYLHVHVNNPAQILYFHHGFRVTSVAPTHFGAANSGLKMVKIL